MNLDDESELAIDCERVPALSGGGGAGGAAALDNWIATDDGLEILGAWCEDVQSSAATRVDVIRGCGQR